MRDIVDEVYAFRYISASNRARRGQKALYGVQIMRIIHIQVGITVISISVIIIHIIWPELSIDSITLSLLVLATIPWIAPVFKSLEFPGGWKIEFQDLQKAEKEAEKAGLLSAANLQDASPEYSFQVIADDDPNLALAGLRIEIEKRLQSIAKSNDIPINKQSVGNLMRILTKKEVLSKNEYYVLKDMVGMLNSAVHGASVDSRAVAWAMETGPRLLKSLEGKI